MHLHDEVLVNVRTITLENGTMFHSKVIGLPFFTVTAAQAENEGLPLVPASESGTIN